MNIEEIWVWIKGYKGLYEVSTEGRIRSVDRRVWNKANNTMSTISGTVLNTDTNKNSYVQVSLCKEGVSKHHLVHRLVAIAFIPNPKRKPQINHINEIKSDNRAHNLEWATSKENINHGQRNRKAALSNGKPVIKMDLAGNEIKRYLTMADTVLDGFHKEGVCKCCKGKLKTSGGFKWMYA